MKFSDVQIGNYYQTQISGKRTLVYVSGYEVDLEKDEKTGKTWKVTRFYTVRAGWFDGQTFVRTADKLRVCPETRDWRSLSSSAVTHTLPWEEKEAV